MSDESDICPVFCHFLTQTSESDLSDLLQLTWANFGLKMASVLSSVYRYVSEGHLLSLKSGVTKLVGTIIQACISGK